MTVRVSKPQINLREELSALKKKSGIKGEELLRANTVSDVYTAINPVMYRNKLINGDFQVSQRGDYSTATAISTATYYLDRWVTVSNLTGTIQRNEVTLPDGTSTYSCKITSTQTGSGYIQIRQIIEGYKPFINKNITISAWIRSNKNDTTGFGLAYLPTNAGSWVIKEKVICDGVWRKYTFNVDVGAVTGNTMVGIQNNHNWISGEYYEVALFQLELGSVATPFENRPYGVELQLCQRYYWQYGGTTAIMGVGMVIGSTGVFFPIKTPVTMRAAPTVTFNSQVNWRGHNTGGGGIQLAGITATGDTTSDLISIQATLSASVTSGYANLIIAGWNSAPGYLYASAEL